MNGYLAAINMGKTDYVLRAFIQQTRYVSGVLWGPNPGPAAEGRMRDDVGGIHKPSGRKEMSRGTTGGKFEKVANPLVTEESSCVDGWQGVLSFMWRRGSLGL